VPYHSSARRGVYYDGFTYCVGISLICRCSAVFFLFHLSPLRLFGGFGQTRRWHGFVSRLFSGAVSAFGCRAHCMIRILLMRLTARPDLLLLVQRRSFGLVDDNQL